MKVSYLDFEQGIAELEKRIDALQVSHDDHDELDISKELEQLQKKNKKLLEDTYKNLSAWQISQVARHPQRPYTLDYIANLFTDFVELHGDRAYADDPAIVGGLARFEGIPVMVIGHQKGRDVKERQYRNFGMPRPEGYRKALRLFRLAEKFGLPIITLIDTPGAYPGIGAEERGQSEAIARNLYVMSELKTPILGVIIGEGGLYFMEKRIKSTRSCRNFGYHRGSFKSVGFGGCDCERTARRRASRYSDHNGIVAARAKNRVGRTTKERLREAAGGALRATHGLWQVQRNRQQVKLSHISLKVF